MWRFWVGCGGSVETQSEAISVPGPQGTGEAGVWMLWSRLWGLEQKGRRTRRNWSWDVRTARTCCSTGTESAHSSSAHFSEPGSGQVWMEARGQGARWCHHRRLAFQDTGWRMDLAGQMKSNQHNLINLCGGTRGYCILLEIYLQCWILFSIPKWSTFESF